MKHLITILAIIAATVSFAQNISGSAKLTTNAETKLENLSIEATIDSAVELETVFEKESMEKLFSELGDIDDITFKLTCKGKPSANGVDSSVSYEIKGNSAQKDVFLAQVELIKRAARAFYNKQN
jgi:hypothetical protein